MSTPDGDDQRPRGLPLVPVAAALAQLALLAIPLAVADQRTAALALFLGEGLLLVGLGLTLLRRQQPVVAVGSYVACLVILVGIAIAGWLATDALWTGALGLAIVAAVVAYGIHRYQVAFTELAPAEAEQS